MKRLRYVGDLMRCWRERRERRRELEEERREVVREWAERTLVDRLYASEQDPAKEPWNA